MQVRALYRVRFYYTDNWYINHGAPHSVEGQTFGLIEGTCEGGIRGRLRGANHGHWRSDDTFLPDFQGVIETEDGAIVYADYRGYSRAAEPGVRQTITAGVHLSDDERYRWLNNVLCVGVGMVHTPEGERSELTVDWYEIVWETPKVD